MPVPPQFLPGYVSKSQTATTPTTTPTTPKKFVPTKPAATQQTAKAPPETPAQKQENAAVLTKVLKANNIDPATAKTIVSQFKAQDN